MTTERPACKLGGTDGNVYAVIGKVARTLRDAGQPERSADFKRRAFGSDSYDAVLRLVMEFVDVE